jgi:hypothetical protein
MSTILKLSNKEEYRLYCDYNAMCMVEEVTRLSGMDLLEEKNIGFGVIRAYLYAALLEYNPGITLSESGNILQRYMSLNRPDGLGKITKILMTEYKKSGCFGDENENVLAKDNYADEYVNEEKKR